MENLYKYYYHLTSGAGGDGLEARRRRLQFQLPDYTSPPLPVALAVTPEAYLDEAVVQEARDLAAGGNCTLDGNRCQIPFPVKDFDTKFEYDQDTSRVGVVFYNGGLVDPRSYAPIAYRLNERYGLPVVMPIFAADLAFTVGVCDTNRLDFAKAEFPEVEKWVLAGHSFGGVAAGVDLWNRYNTTGDASAAGLALLAADLQAGLGCGDPSFANTDMPMAQLLASNDEILNRTRVDANRFRNSADATLLVEIPGASHASFGAYNDSLRFEMLFGQTDGNATIPSEVAWDIAAGAIANVAARTGVPMPVPCNPKSAASYAALSPWSIWSTILLVGLFLVKT